MSEKLPSKYRHTVVKTLSIDFRKATEIIESPLPKPGPKEVLIKNRFVGINATDINFTNGTYLPGVPPPFGCGFEGLGDIVEVGSDSQLKVGQSVVYLNFGAFAEYKILPAASAIPVPTADPALISVGLSGLTASISLEKDADLKTGKTVLVTAAAGGTGQFAVQLAKAAGCQVVGTCSTDAKVDFLKSIGCDRPINYKKENLDDVLTKEYPKGFDVVYESVGGEIFKTAMKHIAQFGRILVIGAISGYLASDRKKGTQLEIDAMAMISKSASVKGFLLSLYRDDGPRHIGTLTEMLVQGKLKIAVDRGAGKPFQGLEAIPEAIDYMYSGKNVGKVVVSLE